MIKTINEVIETPSKLPESLIEGVTYLLPKDNDTENPEKYRPIACLPTIYKIITACIANKIAKYCDEHSILQEQQKGCKRKTLGCKEQLITDQVVIKQAKKCYRNLYTAYIDYRKAFDSVPHSWLIQVLKMYQIDNSIIEFLIHTMKRWKTTIRIKNRRTETEIEDIKIK